MRGLRTLEGDRFERFFAIVQDFAARQGCAFFLDSGDGREMETETLSCDDLFGWLIPMELAAEFEQQFIAFNVDEDRWDDFMLFAIWSIEDGNITVEFKSFDY